MSVNSNPRSVAEVAAAFQFNVFKFGRGTMTTNRNIIWDGANGVYQGFLSAANTVEVESTSVDDVSAGGGAVSIGIVGQDADGYEISEIIPLNGLTAVQSLREYTIVYRAYVFTTEDESERTGPNHGDISIYETGGSAANSMAQIKATFGQTLMCIYRIPQGFKDTSDNIVIGPVYGELTRVRAWPSGNATAITRVTAFVRNNIGRGNAWTIAGSAEMSTGAGQADIDLTCCPRFAQPGTDIIICGEMASGTGIASANFDIILRPL